MAGHPKGGSFLLAPVASAPIFSPEQLGEEQRMFFRTAVDFVEKEIQPRALEIEAKKPGLLRELLEKAGELGMLMVEIPEQHGGLGADLTTALLMAEAVARNGSWSVTIGAHTGIGTNPILFFGNEEQKARYLPALATGEKIAAYALTEPNAGSDALAGRTKAVLSEDGKHYLLNGSKMWITNGGIADVFVVFAKVDGDKMTGFIVEKDTPGFSHGAEEHKMGIRGSSTTALDFEDAKVPVENVLYEVGKGHKIAFNILNLGRLKLGFGTLGGAKNLIKDAVQYAGERKTFGQPLTAYGMIRQKLARMASLVYVGESMGYRTAGMIDGRIEAGGGHESSDAVREALEEYAIESSIMKVFGSETLHYVADEDVQIHGGYGFSEDYMIERAYRDQRVNRIFEGTNEINRLLVPGMILRRTLKGELPLMQFSAEVMQALESEQAVPTFDGPLAWEKRAAESVKRMAIYVTSMAVGKIADTLKDDQDVLGPLADVLTVAYALDSSVARTLQHQDDRFALREALLRHYAAEHYEQAYLLSRNVLAMLAEGEELAGMLERLAKLHVSEPVNTKKTQETIVEAVIEAEGYPFSIA